MPKTYSEKMTHRSVVLVVGTLGVAFTAKAAMLKWGGDHGGWLAFGLILFTFSVFFLLSIWFWRSLDDLQRQGQAVSWYWGSIAGLGIAACWIVGTGQGQSDFTKGVGALAMLQMCCALLLHAFWWLRGRGLSFGPGE